MGENLSILNVPKSFLFVPEGTQAHSLPLNSQS